MGLPFPSPEDLPYLGTEPCSSAMQEVSLLSELQQIQQESPLTSFPCMSFFVVFLFPASYSQQNLSSMIRDSTRALGRKIAES